MMQTPRLFLKDEVKINGRHFDFEIYRIIQVARRTIDATDLTDGAVWITSGNDGEHMQNSKHYSNEAFDIRTRNVKRGPPAVREWARRMQEELGSDYDVVLEIDHIHAEYDPD